MMKRAKTKNTPVLDTWRSRRRCAAAARRARDTQSGTPEWSPPSAPVPTPTGNADTGTCWNNIQLSPLKVWKTWLTSFLKWAKANIQAIWQTARWIVTFYPSLLVTLQKASFTQITGHHLNLKMKTDTFRQIWVTINTILHWWIWPILKGWDQSATKVLILQLNKWLFLWMCSISNHIIQIHLKKDHMCLSCVCVCE